MAFTPDSVEAISFDFRTLKVDGKPGPKGAFPEPTREQLQAFGDTVNEWRTGMATLAADSQKSGKSPSKQKSDKLNRMILDAVATLSGGTISRAQLEALPPRVQDGFLTYLMGELLDPTLRTPATSASPAALNGVGSPT
jgi:hypothetical protein